MFTKAKLIVNGQTFNLMLTRCSVRHSDNVEVHHGGYIPAFRYMRDQSFVVIEGYVLPQEKVGLPVIKRDRFTLASLIKHEDTCRCTRCVAYAMEDE